MRVLISVLAAGVAAASLSACASDGYGRSARYDSPRQACLRDRQNDRLAGAAVGAVVGALAGSAVAGNSSNTAGTVAGGVAGAVIGDQVAKGAPCPPGYAYQPY